MGQPGHRIFSNGRNHHESLRLHSSRYMADECSRVVNVLNHIHRSHHVELLDLIIVFLEVLLQCLVEILQIVELFPKLRLVLDCLLERTRVRIESCYIRPQPGEALR